MKIYFGHPVNVYDTYLEDFLMKKIAETFPEMEIENPNQSHHADGYKRYSAGEGRGMDYYFKEVLPACNAGVFLPFRDGKWGTGVFGEAKHIADRGFPIWQISPEGLITPVVLNPLMALSVAETKARIRTVSGEILPY